MLRINQLNGFGARSEAFSVQVGETRLSPTSGGTSRFYSDLYLGPSVRNRWFIICMNYRNDQGPNAVILGGVAATQAVIATQTDNTPDTKSRIYYVRLDSPAVAELEVDWGAGVDAAVTLFRVTSAKTLVFDTANGSTSSGTVALSIDAAAGGAIFATSCSNQDNPVANWTGVTEVVQSTAGTGGQHAVAYQDNLAAQLGRGVSITGGSSPSRSMCALSVSPT